MKSTGSLRANLRSRSQLTIAAVVAVALIVTSGGPVAAESTPEEAQTDSKSSKVESRPDRVSAMSTAQAQNSRVEDLSARTESSSSFANPDGSWTTETFAGPTQTKDDKGELAPLDSDLVREEGKVKPGASEEDVTFSDGGDKTVGTLRSDKDKSVGIKIDDENLPKPTVKDSTLTYPSAVGGHDLVVRSFPSGFNFSVVVDERPSANADPLEFAFPLALEGLEATMAENGSMLFKSGKKVVASSSAPVMWDSSESDDKAAVPVAAKLVEGALVLRPSMEYLGDPKTEFPVTVDPSIVLNVASDTWVDSLLNSSSQISSTQLQVGSSTLGVVKARSYLNFDVSSLSSDVVVSAASVDMTNYATGACSGTALTMRQITGSWTPGSITWSTQPTTESSGTSSSQSFGASACPAEGVVSFDATSIVNDWIGGDPNLGVQIKADNESAASGFRRFHSMENGDAAKAPKLSITYNTKPGVPSNLEVTPTVQDGSDLLTSATRPTFAAGVADADGSQVEAEFKLTKGGTTVDSVTLDPVPSGTRVTRKPASALTEGTYVAQWRVSDGELTSAWSPGTTVVVDLTPPGVPTIGCTSTTADAWYDTRPASTTSCTITAGSGTDKVGAILNGEQVEFPALSSGTTSKSFDLPTSGMFDLDVTAWDKAGNGSTKSHTFGIGDGALTSPLNGTRSVNRFSVNATSKSGATSAKLQWRLAGDTSWIDATEVSQGGSPWSGTTTTQGNMSRTGVVSWAAADESAAQNPSLVEARVCFSYSSDPDRCTVVTSLALVPHAFGGTFPTTTVGPAEVALQTGEFQLGMTDVDVPGLSLSRSYQSYDGPASASESVFGPGWVANLEGPPTGLAAATVIDETAANGTIILIVDGASSVYRHESGDKGAQAVGVYEPQGEAEMFNEKLELIAGTPKTLVLTEGDSTETTWEHISGAAWTIKKVDDPTADPPITYTHDSNGLVTGIYDGPTGVTCNTTTQDRGCNALLLSYVTVAGEKRLDKVDFKTWDPQPGSNGAPGTGTMSTTTVARYDYDSGGKLTASWDPRLTSGSGPLETEYTYQTVGGQTYLESAKPPGLKPWEFNLKSSGELETITRPQDSAVGGTATWRLVYDVATSGSGLPDLSSQAIAAWQQPVAPLRGTAVFGPDAPDTSDYRYADIYYFTRDGVVTNTASFGAGKWLIDSQAHDVHGNLKWTLDAHALDRSLSASLDPWAIRNLMGTSYVHSADGTRVELSFAPLRYVVLENGTGLTGRPITEYVYDDEAAGESVPAPGRPTPSTDPTDPKPNLVVEERYSMLAGTTRYDTRKTRYRYDKVESTDADGWDLGVATRVSTQLDGGWSTELSRHDARGMLIETRSPQGVASHDGAGSDGRSTIVHYFTSDGSSPIASCRNRPEWVDLICRTGPAGGSAPVTTSAGFDYLQNETRKTEVAGSMTRTSVETYDAAGRVTQSTVDMSGAPSGDQAVPETTYTYSPSTGAQITSAADGSTIATTYDTWGRALTQTDGKGSTATYSYDAADRVHTVGDGKGTYTYTYDGSDARGEVERRGLVTKLDVGLPSGPDEFKSAYDSGGNEVERQMPGGIIATSTYDHVDRQTALVYSRDAVVLTGQLAQYDAQGRIRLAQSVLTYKDFKYDGRDRLVEVKDDFFLGGCTTRKYEFSLDSNRTKLETSAPAGDGSCTDASPVTDTSTFDADSKITDSGYTYDDFGRTRTLPAADTDQPTGPAASISYHSNEKVADIEQGSQAKAYTLDAAQRISKITQSTSGVALREVTNHYADGSDSPSWVATATRPDASAPWTNTWTRWVNGPDALLAIEQGSDGTSRLQMVDMVGDIISTLPVTGGGPGLQNYQEFTEYGLPHADMPSLGGTYGPLGAHQRSRDSAGGLTLMGARLYNPETGRFLTRDPVPGGNDNAYIYPTDPINSADISGKTTWYTKRGGSKIWIPTNVRNKIIAKHGIRTDVMLYIIKKAYWNTSVAVSRPTRRAYDWLYRRYECDGSKCVMTNWVTIRMIVDWEGYGDRRGTLITMYCVLSGTHMCPRWVQLTRLG